ncbi:MAG: dihydrofolate reductase family protein [Thermoplasmata archaeon]
MGRPGSSPSSTTSYWTELDEELARTGAASVDTILLGRGTYEVFASYWPGAQFDPEESKLVQEQARYLNETPKLVFSRSLSKVDWKGARIVKGDLTRVIRRLERLPGKNMIVPGGVRLPRALIERDLIDEYLLTVVPMIMGSGTDRLFGKHSVPKTLRLVRSRPFSNGAMFQHYEPIR